MREIKFRAWDGQRIWKLIDGPAYSFKIYSDGSGRFGNEGGDDDLRFYRGENSEVKVMQYTGLKDKNGVEIYEGDIMQFNDGTCRAVAHDAEHTGFKLDGEDPVNPLWQMHGSMEVIGNIYENPELLESK